MNDNTRLSETKEGPFLAPLCFEVFDGKYVSAEEATAERGREQ
jgi:hypothetical protein